MQKGAPGRFRERSRNPVRWEGGGAIVVALIACLTTTAVADAQELPQSIQAPGETPLLSVHAEGAQIYECAQDATGKLAWRLREPIATLLREGKTIGRHYAGPEWRLDDGSGVQGKLEAKAPGATPSDIPWLKLAAVAHTGHGDLEQVTTIQRIDTHGGALDGECATAGALRSVAYSADYVFLRK
jgi:hypothetical protein